MAISFLLIFCLTACGSVAAPTRHLSSLPGVAVHVSLDMPDGPTFEVPIVVSIKGTTRGPVFIGLSSLPPGATLDCPYLPEIASFHSTPPKGFAAKGLPQAGVLLPGAPVDLAFTLLYTPKAALPTTITVIAAERQAQTTKFVTHALTVHPRPFRLPTAPTTVKNLPVFLTTWNTIDTLLLQSNPTLDRYRTTFRHRLRLSTGTWQSLMEVAGRTESQLGTLNPGLVGSSASSRPQTSSQQAMAEEKAIAVMDVHLKQLLGPQVQSFERLAATETPSWQRELGSDTF